jgi:hypothetical protein
MPFELSAVSAAALLVFLPTAAGARIIAADLGAVVADRLGRGRNAFRGCAAFFFL